MQGTYITKDKYTQIANNLTVFSIQPKVECYIVFSADNPENGNRVKLYAQKTQEFTINDSDIKVWGKSLNQAGFVVAGAYSIEG